MEKNSKLSLTMKVKADTTVIQPLIDKLRLAISKFEPGLSERFSEAFELLLNSGNLFFEICTVEQNRGATDAAELLVTLYPTDRFLMFARAVFAGDLDSLIVE
ncbi:hypothetical protein [Pseudoalteromonas sp. R3]|uniref:hypothetical protein n=1 Tax=Pseudoalteromonas sp. R3 TaxID=1709477 RepID=UPI0006B4BDCE|nr:hypothetical protein [Pseudoalteromonas sp. R3]AZZ98779.1 hypothetical protein ELR70_17735 [Pseudoalteromonas sp. R3]